MGRVVMRWLRRALDYAGIVSLVRALDLDVRAIVAGAVVSVPGDAVTGVAVGLVVAVRFSPRRRLTQPWQRTAGARLQGLLLRPLLGQLAGVKLEEWRAELAGIGSRWERAAYLVDLICYLPQQARAAREGEPGESA